MFAPGSTCLLASGTYHRPDLTHLHIVCTDSGPDGLQIMVPVCSWTNELCDPTTVLEVGDHPWINRKSYVMYGKAKLLTRQELIPVLRKRDHPVTKPLLDRVREGICISGQTRRKIKRHFGCKVVEPTCIA